MKITIDIDCTPEEAREFMGLPNMEDVQKHFMGAFQSQMKDFQGKTEDMKPEDYLSMWSQIGQQNMQNFQAMMAEQMKDKADKKDKK